MQGVHLPVPLQVLFCRTYEESASHCSINSIFELRHPHVFSQFDQLDSLLLHLLLLVLCVNISDTSEHRIGDIVHILGKFVGNEGLFDLHVRLRVVVLFKKLFELQHVLRLLNMRQLYFVHFIELFDQPLERFYLLVEGYGVELSFVILDLYG